MKVSVQWRQISGRPLVSTNTCRLIIINHDHCNEVAGDEDADDEVFSLENHLRHVLPPPTPQLVQNLRHSKSEVFVTFKTCNQNQLTRRINNMSGDLGIPSKICCRVRFKDSDDVDDNDDDNIDDNRGIPPNFSMLSCQVQRW